MGGWYLLVYSYLFNQLKIKILLAYLLGTYSIDDFNAKIKVAILQQRQDWGRPQIKGLRLVIPKDYTFMADNTIFIALGIQGKYLEKIMLIRSTFPWFL